MRLRFVVALLAVLAIVMPLAAQEQAPRSKASSATRRAARSSARPSPQRPPAARAAKAVTDPPPDDCFVSTPPPGLLTRVSATLSGFGDRQRLDIHCPRGGPQHSDLRLPPAAWPRRSRSSGVAAPSDVKQSARATNLREEAIEKMPKGRDFHVARGPGPRRAYPHAELPGDLHPCRVRRPEPLHHRRRGRWSLRYGTSGKPAPITDFVEEVQVKSEARGRARAGPPVASSARSRSRVRTRSAAT